MTAALVVLSGGQDSTTCLFWAKQKFDDVEAVTFDYGQRHKAELEAARRVAVLAGVSWHEVVPVPAVFGGSSPLVSDSKLETYASFAEMDAVIGDRVELTFVPGRNLVFLGLAMALAAGRGIDHLVTGICESDNANYPDCRGEFVTQMERCCALALDRGFRIHTPLLTLTKAETVQLGVGLSGCMHALAYSHTCYAGAYPPCGECHACVLRAQGFAEAGVTDPLLEAERIW